MRRFLVIEARRLLPLMFLLVLLVSLSIYDNFFRIGQPVLQPGDEETANVLTFITAGRGELAAEAFFEVIQTGAQWVELMEGCSYLPHYTFNEAYEMAVSAVNSEIKNISIFPQTDGMVQVQVRVEHRPRSYHIVTVERERLGEGSRWLFLDSEDRVLDEVILLPAPETEEPSETGSEL